MIFILTKAKKIEKKSVFAHFEFVAIKVNTFSGMRSLGFCNTFCKLPPALVIHLSKYVYVL